MSKSMQEKHMQALVKLCALFILLLLFCYLLFIIINVMTDSAERGQQWLG